MRCAVLSLCSVLLVALTSAEPLRFQPQGGATVLCPDKQGTCPGGSTCCLLQSGRYGCCPLPQAVCCSDHLHCCPSGYKCNVAAGQCNRGDHTIPMATKTPADPVAMVTQCLGDAVTCPRDATCCQGDSPLDFSCCMLPESVCCAGGRACCPKGSSCSKNGCVSNKDGRQLSWYPTKPAATTLKPAVTKDKAAASPRQPVVTPAATQLAGQNKRLVCPGGKTYCETGRTCCYRDNGHFGCCSYVNGTCCGDRKHCCPLGFSCDTKAEKCVKGGGSLTLPLGKTNEPKPNDPEPEPQSVICPDGSSTCDDGSTCCLMLSGQYGCCPLPTAVCCSDHLHCCPFGSTCDVAAGTCLQSDGQSLPWAQKRPANRPPTVSGTPCHDNKTSCEDGTTCCQMLDGYYGCCPFADAICCPDKLHCCPNTQKCDVKRGECISSDGLSSPWAAKLPGTPTSVPPTVQLSAVVSAVAANVCPDKTTCDDKSTCCQLVGGGYGCCPMVKATCCSDHSHCCPQGYTCKVHQGTCTEESTGHTVQWQAKTPARAPVQDTICPDKKSYCPGLSTCCKQTSGQYGCCPLPQATCCSDGVHCCPTGYTCDVAKSACLQAGGTTSVPWSKKTPARPVADAGTTSLGWVVCPDKQSQCQDGYTCCKLPSGQFGCCPMPKAVCCSDGLHCCPSGMTCNDGMCRATDSSLSLSWSGVRRTLKLDTPVARPPPNTQCADKTECPQGSTCCQMKSGKYGCCPYNNGTCCADKIHCCPAGFKCDASGSRCDKADDSLSLSSAMFTRNKPTMPVAVTMKDDDVMCPDKSVCEEGNTCCQNKAGQYECCPFGSAVCCKDGIHCCPQGYACDPQSGTCTQASNPWLTKVPATPRSSAQP